MSRPPEMLRFITADAPNANGQRPAPGAYFLVVWFELEDGRHLFIEMGAENARRFRDALASTAAPPARQTQAALPLEVAS